MNLQEMIQENISLGYSDENAQAKVCQDLILLGLSKSSLSRNAIGPGYIRTNQTESYLANKENYEAITRHIPMKRVGTPEDLVGGCIFLASNASNYVTGHTLYIEGGRLID